MHIIPLGNTLNLKDKIISAANLRQ